jgi:hypothetical protein
MRPPLHFIKAWFGALVLGAKHTSWLPELQIDNLNYEISYGRIPRKTENKPAETPFPFLVVIVRATLIDSTPPPSDATI